LTFNTSRVINYQINGCIFHSDLRSKTEKTADFESRHGGSLPADVRRSLFTTDTCYELGGEMPTREHEILAYLDQGGVASYQELAELLGVSTMTIRREVDRLAQKGMAVKVLGGAQKANSPAYLYETELISRLVERTKEKHAIAVKAAEAINDRMTIFLDGSTTCLELAKVIACGFSGLTIVTNSALVCMELGSGGQKNMIVAIGGQYDPSSLSYVGPTTEQQASNYFVDLAFMSTKGFIPNEGTYESSVATFHVKQIIARQSSKVALLIDHTKFGRRALSKVLDISEFNTVVTDDKTRCEYIDELKGAGKEVIVAQVNARAVGTPSGTA
jgi:DeoR family transcriptional regulator, fructose operon transcriptional repressor